MKNELEIFLEQFDKLTLDSTQISKNTVFIAYPGKKFDGRDFIEQAINNGAKGVVFESENFKKNNVELHTLSSYDMLLEQALSSNYITDSDFQTIKKWKKDPENW